MFLPYLLVPLTTYLVIGKTNLPKTGVTYLVYLVFFLPYPFLTFEVDEYLNPQTTDLSCGMPQFAWALFNWIVVIPTLFILQALVNRILVKSSS
ncbi:hypothetical protein DC20_19080 [Rufibacter tibetensis]|uniref:Lycopene cyclase domain-containing protein n=1 Tax=Rufibacter tibetensis TaxID=512763 RepID=A0A0P0C6Q7_9BACT|nr:hypothetical protein DC20_19080 [Rufibacter tibetensis]